MAPFVSRNWAKASSMANDPFGPEELPLGNNLRGLLRNWLGVRFSANADNIWQHYYWWVVLKLFPYPYPIHPPWNFFFSCNMLLLWTLLGIDLTCLTTRPLEHFLKAILKAVNAPALAPEAALRPYIICLPWKLETELFVYVPILDDERRNYLTFPASREGFSVDTECSSLKTTAQMSPNILTRK